MQNQPDRTHVEVPDKILERIQRALALTEERGASEHEAQAALALVARLCAEHHITIADALDHTASTASNTHNSSTHRSPDEHYRDTRGHVVIDMGIASSTSPNWCIDLAQHIARATFTKRLFFIRSNRIIFIGSPEDTTLATTLYTFLVKQINQITHNSWRALPAKSRANYRRFGLYRLPFALGVVKRLGERLALLHEQLASVHTALVPLVNQIAKANEEYTKTIWPTIKNTKTKPLTVDHRAFTAGYLAADQIKLTPNAELPE
jgi:hypothetical protein